MDINYNYYLLFIKKTYEPVYRWNSSVSRDFPILSINVQNKNINKVKDFKVKFSDRKMWLQRNQGTANLIGGCQFTMARFNSGLTGETHIPEILGIISILLYPIFQHPFQSFLLSLWSVTNKVSKEGRGWGSQVI